MWPVHAINETCNFMACENEAKLKVKNESESEDESENKVKLKWIKQKGNKMIVIS